jgi:hypothetical protein
MSIRFVTVNKAGQNVYVQYRLMSPSWSTDVRDWLSDDGNDDIEEIERRISDISKTASTSDAEEIEITTDDGKTITSITAKRVSDENDVVEFCNDNKTEVYARIGIVGDKSGVFAKNVYDMNGNPISGFEIDTENEVMIIAGRKYKLIPYVE